ncbi:MAG: single-stranded DNA-binding protein [Tannerella sp.]|jgi:single-strand DNA-binding protein|nr:single-stranded DNA-binding protein [Tannerella sp.]
MSLNKVILIGNVGKDPVVRYFDSGNAIANFSVATSEKGYTLANGTEVPERTEWHNIVAGRDRVQFVEKYVKKGSLVYVEGKIRTRNYDDQSGVKHYVTEIYADRIEFYSLGRRPDSADNVNAPVATTNAPAPAPAPSYRAAVAEPPAIPDSTDDLPF